MGGSASSELILPDPVDETSTNMCLLCFPSYMRGDELSLLYGNDDIFTSIRAAVKCSWPLGIAESKSPCSNFGGFKLNGYPFAVNLTNSPGHRRRVDRMICAIIQKMTRNGYILRSTINFHRQTKSDSFLFEFSTAEGGMENVCALDLQTSNQLQLIGMPPQLHNVIEQVIIEQWPAGIKKQKFYPQSNDSKFILKGNPWRAESINKDLANSRMIILKAVRAISDHGFAVIGSGHYQQAEQEVDTMFFASTESQPSMDQSFIFGPMQHDKMIVVDATDLCLHAIRECIRTTWPENLYEEEEVIGPMAAMKLQGFPWLTRGTNAINARLLIIRIFEKLRSIGWRVYATIDMNKNLNDTSCFLMVRCNPEDLEYMALKLSGSKSMRFVNAPAGLQESVARMLMALLPGKVSRMEEDDSLVLKFEDHFKDIQGIFCFIIGRIESFGWTLISSADLSVKCVSGEAGRYPKDFHTLFFEK